MKSFFFHYNKPKTLQEGRPIISIHFDKVCHFVDNVIINVTTIGKIRKRQPRFVICGKCNKISIKNRVATIS